MSARTVILTVAVVASLTSAASASASSVKGTYPCSPAASGTMLLPPDSSIALLSSGRYKMIRIGANGGPMPSGTYTRNGSKLTFRGGTLAGKHATLKTSKVYGRQFTFSSLLGGGRHVCTKQR
jgi:hypothetical protein